MLDLTRVIAGPVCGRTLAAHGADVMRITAPHLPGFPLLDIDTGRGKLSAALDLRAEEDCERLGSLLREAHVFVQGYRPGGVASLGFSPEACAEIRPGIVTVSLSAYGHAGPWASRRGFDSLVQNASGINHAEAEAAGITTGPKELPAQALDHATGYLMAFGAMMALARKAREGGSWHVRVSLAQTAHWLTRLGRLPNGFDCPDPKHADVGRSPGRDGHAAGSTDVRQACRGALGDAGILGPAPGAARHARSRLAGVRRHPRARLLLAFGFFLAGARRAAASAPRAQSSISSGSSNSRSGTCQ